MKRVLFGLMLILGVSATQVNAQSVTTGVKAEANLSNFILSDMPTVKNNLGIGATIGGFVKFDISNNFAIQPELLFHFQSSKMEQLSIENNYEYWGVEIPVYAIGQWTNSSNGRFYAGVGPYIGLGFDARYTDPEYKLYEDDTMQPVDFGFGLQVGYEFAGGFQINAGYKLGVVNALDKAKDISTMLPQRISLGIGFRF